ncbi:DUF3618 domain-containing protein [Paraoerskovia marina]|uniref:DUF3618 domain-containing protein n=1 Tax=Paraoerskovia marina TaxID=545619 RepID=A0A1H1W3I8_9CELL|nr:DUF3618 domain-containing protein [Paraoerskovia marina]SDS91858.1 Protein of unknown function [Paraoerskovia marina]
MSDDPQSLIEAEIAKTRAELAGTVDELTDRLAPANLARSAGAATKQAALDTQDFITGKGMPTTSPRRQRNVKALLGTAAAVAVAVTVVVIRIARK